MKIKTDLDYIRYYAEKLKEANKLFKQQKNLMGSQFKSYSSSHKKMFDTNFKANARKYLKNIGLLK